MASDNYNARRTRIDVEGEAEIKRILQSIGIAANDILDEAAMAGADIVLEDAIENCPVDADIENGEPPGTLKSAIKLRKPRKNNTKLKKTSSAGVYIDSRIAPYGTSVELGHKIVNKDGEVVGRAEAVPFLRNSVDNNKSDIPKAVTDTIGAAIDEVMR